MPASNIDWTTARVVLPGGAGFLGRHVAAVLKARGVAPDRLFIPRRREYDLTQPAGASLLMREAFGGRADVVINCAGAVGGLGAHKTMPAKFAHDNLAIIVNLVEAARLAGVAQRGGVLVHIGSMTSYPAEAPVPFCEEDLWKGYPEAGTAPYAVAKLAALPVLEAYRSQYGLKSAYVIPTNLYGPGDNFDERTSHAAAAIVRRCVEAADRGDEEIVNWGTGSPSRQFLFVEDAARGVVAAAERMEEPVPINLGTGVETTVKEFVEAVASAAGFKGRVAWDASKPDGIARRSLSAERAQKLLGWRAEVGLEEGVRKTVEWWRGSHSSKVGERQGDR
jgi:GDP-L-fucose synthase